MRLEYIAALSRPGNPAKPNDDAFCHADNLAAVFDGATSIGEPLLPADSDAAWLARKGAEGLIAHAGLGARAALRSALEDAEREFIAQRLRPPAEPYEIPLASMMLVSPAADGLACFWFGDCALLVLRPGEQVEVVGHALMNRAAEARQAAALARSKGLTPAAEQNRPQYLEALRAGRNRAHRGVPRAFAPDRRAIERVKSGTIAVPPGSVLLLCSDGFLALASDYGAYDADRLVVASLANGLPALFHELRAIEEEDPEGVRFPRFKKSDDATALLLRLEKDE